MHRLAVTALTLVATLGCAATTRADPPRPNTVVTLDDVYEAVTGRPKGTR